MTAHLPPAMSLLLDPADEPYLRLLQHCARARRELGLPSLSGAELELLLERDEPGVALALPPNVLPFRRRRPF